MDEILYNNVVGLVGLFTVIMSVPLFVKAIKYEFSMDVKLLSRETLYLLSIMLAILGLALIFFNFGFHIDRAPFGAKRISFLWYK
jgi:uncharacterized membrane protein